MQFMSLRPIVSIKKALLAFIMPTALILYLINQKFMLMLFQLVLHGNPTLFFQKLCRVVMETLKIVHFLYPKNSFNSNYITLIILSCQRKIIRVRNDNVTQLLCLIINNIDLSKAKPIAKTF